jgi:hypothetical protein
VPIVLVLATVLAITGMFVLRNTKQQNRQNITNFTQIQAHFFARAGLEHALLKTKYLHRELYDAACLAQGRNPLFDFSQVTAPGPGNYGISPINPGPAFLYRHGEAAPEGFFTKNFDTTLPAARSWIETFRRDLVSGMHIDGTNINFVMTGNPLPNAIRSLMREPFTGQYEVRSINLMAQSVAETAVSAVDNQAIIEIEVVANITTARGETFEQRVKRTLRVARDYRR